MSDEELGYQIVALLGLTPDCIPDVARRIGCAARALLAKLEAE